VKASSLTRRGWGWRVWKQPKAKDALSDGNFRSFVVSVRDEGGQVVLRMALSLVVESLS
jgi:hypothetical protein